MLTDDYIKRSDCLEAMKKAERWWWNADDLRQYHEIIESIPAADVEPKERWIPVTERLPKPVSAQTRRKTKPVLLYSPKGGFYVGWCFGKDYRGHVFTNRTSKDSFQYIATKITHWMPLHEPPKEKKELC